MQVIVCREEIGWRYRARRLLIIATASGLRNNNKGESVLKPNDGECHMRNHTYTHSLTEDYPSVDQINDKIRNNAINLIFAVTENQIGDYEKLSRHIEGSYASRIEQESSFVTELIRDEYSVKNFY